MFELSGNGTIIENVNVIDSKNGFLKKKSERNLWI